MKKKSFLSGINTKIVLAALALSNVMLTGCYKDEGLDTNGPAGVVTLPDATYTLTGSIYDAETMEAITPTSVTVTNSTATVKQGSYSAVVAPGDVTITVKAAGYKDVTTTVYIQPVEKGQAVVYTQPIAMISSAVKPELVDQTYNLNVKAFELDGMTEVAEYTVKVNGADVANPYVGGAYGVLVTADGYHAYSTVVSLPAVKVEKGTATMDVEVKALLTKVDAPAPTKVNFIVNFQTTNGTYFNVQRAWLLNNGVEVADAVATNTSFFSYSMDKEDVKGTYAIAYQYEANINGEPTVLRGTQTVDAKDNYLAFVTFEINDKGEITDSSDELPAIAEETITVPISGGTVTLPGSKVDAEGNIIPNATINGEAVETITLQRLYGEEINEPATLRAYSGTPDGTQFVDPIIINFADVYGGELGDLVVKYKQENGTWASEVNEFTTVKLGEDGYQMKIKHFSEFKADLNLEPEAPLAKADSIVKTTTIGKNNDNEGSTDITIKYNYTEGVIYEKSIKDAVIEAGVKNALAQDFIAQTIKNYLNANGYGEFGETDHATEKKFTVPEYTRVESITTTQHISNITIVFVVNKYQIKMNIEKYTNKVFKVNMTPINHGHGHGHGNDFNAGGGIVEAE